MFATGENSAARTSRTPNTRLLILILALVGISLLPIRAGAIDPVTGLPESAPIHSADHTLTVSGNAEVSAAPDEARVRLGATVQTGQADVVQARVNEIMQKALDSIEKLGVP